jgi:type III secretory pathway component EscR
MESKMKSLSPEVLLLLSLGFAAVPLMISVGTCYLKFSIVLGLLRSGFGTQQAPSAALVMALSLVMSVTVMTPVIERTIARASDVKLEEFKSISIASLQNSVSSVIAPWREFLLSHSGERELAVFTALARREEPSAETAEMKDGVTTSVAVGAFVLSEIKRGFTLGFFLLIPFFVIDLVIANLLVAMGLTMMSPVIVSLPIKILLFISTDGWLLLTKNLVQAYH